MATIFRTSLRSPTLRLVPRSTSVHNPNVRPSRPFTTQINSWSRPRFQHHLPRKTSPIHFYSTVVVQDRPRGRTRRIFTAVILSLGSFLVGGYFALSYAPPFLTPLIMGSVPTDEDTLRWEAPDEFTKKIDEHIKNCEIAAMLRADPDWTESRPHLKIPTEIAQHNLTAGTLAGPDMIVVPPYFFNKKGGQEMYCIFYVGDHLSGHPGIVHGGFLATMLDEGLARCAFAAMPNQVGVTANLNINYRKPVMAGQYLVLHAVTTKVEGRKAWAQGVIETLDNVEKRESGEPSKALVEAEALFIEPKHAKILKSLYRQST